MRWPAIFASMALIVLAAAAPVTAARPSGFNFWAHVNYPLNNPTTWIIRGDLSAAGCTISEPALQPSADGSAREQREIAVDTLGCRALVELGGMPATAATRSLAPGTVTEVLPAGAGSEAQAVVSGSNAREVKVKRTGRVSPMSAANPDLPTYRHQKLWREDILGVSVNSIDTKIKYFWDGACALGGTTVAPVTYLHSSGWNLASGASNENETCASYVGTAWATFTNNVFCSQESEWVVTVTYSSDKVTGSKTGAITYSKVYDMSSSCAPLYFHSATGSWTP